MSLSNKNFDTLLAYEASAGSGKTFSLVVRYLSLLILGSPTKSILALTFTKKAAFEMSHRIVESLENLHQKEAELSYLSNSLMLSKDEILKRVDKINATLEISDLNISTIDSFFANTLRLFSFYASLMPNFSIASSKDLNDIEVEFLKRLKQKGMYEAFLKFALRFDKSQKQIFETLDYSYQNQEFHPPKREINPPKKEDILQISHEIRDLFLKNGVSQAGYNHLNAKNIDDLIAKSFLEKESLNYWIYKKSYEPKADELFDELKKMLKSYLNSHESYILNSFENLLKVYEEVRLEQINRKSTLTFSEVSLKTKELLSSIDSDFLYFRLDSKIDHILIDEFQDTNTLQFQIIKPLIDEISSGIGAKEFKSFFFVGDKKQSIYRFRGGKKELFDFVASRYEVKVKRLNVNYRSCKNIVNFANETFINLIDGYTNQQANSSVEGFVEVVKDDDVCQNVYNAMQKLLQNGVKIEDIAILTFVNDDARNIIEFIHAKDKNIKIYNEAKVMLRDIFTVKAIVEFLRYLLFGDRVYKVGFLSLLSLDIDTDIDKTFFDISKPLSSLVTTIIKYFGLYDGDINLLKFLNSLDRYKDIEEFLYSYEEYEEEAVSQKFDGLRVLTIHKSKGLEFESVILADKLKGKNNSANTFIYDSSNISKNVVNLRISKRVFFDDEYKNLVENEKKLSLEDELNALYVAITRAKSNLIIAHKNEKSGFDLLNLSEMKKGEIVKSKDEQKKRQKSKFLKKEEVFYGLQNYTKKQKIAIEDKEAVDFGVAMHYMLEMCGDFSENALEIGFYALNSRFKKLLSHESLDDILSRIRLLVNNKEFNSLIKGKLQKEVPLVIDGELKVIDLLVEFDDKFVIVDYKSSQKFHQKHISQIENYAKGLKAITSKQVDCYLCYLLEESCVVEKVI